MSKQPYIKVLATTEEIDGVVWRLLPIVVETDGKGRHWIPERRVVWIDDMELTAMKECNDE